MIIVSGTARVPADAMARWQSGAAEVIAATRREAGCRAYSFAEDVIEPGLIHTFEMWDSRGHLDAHLQTPHVRAWREVLAEVKVRDRVFHTYEAGEGTPL